MSSPKDFYTEMSRKLLKFKYSSNIKYILEGFFFYIILEYFFVTSYV